MSPALREQLGLQRDNPSCDYVLVGAGDFNAGVQLSNPMGRMAFAEAKTRAQRGEASGVGFVYEMLQEHALDAGISESMLCVQLEREYGVARRDFQRAPEVPQEPPPPTIEDSPADAASSAPVGSTFKEMLLSTFTRQLSDDGGELGEWIETQLPFINAMRAKRPEVVCEAVQIWAHKFAAAGLPSADVASLFVKGLEAAQRSGDMAGNKFLEQASKQGSAFAPWQLAGNFMRRGNVKKALKWNLLGAERGLPHAQHKVAYLLESTDRKEAKKWYLRAVENNYGLSCQNLGILSEEDGDMAAAARWFQRGAELGAAEAMVSYAKHLLECPEGSTGALEEAQRWLEEAAAAGDCDAYFLLGLHHITDSGNYQPLLSAALLLEAVKQGNTQAIHFLPRARGQLVLCATCGAEDRTQPGGNFHVCKCRLVAFCKKECMRPHTCTPGRIPAIETARRRYHSELVKTLATALADVFGTSERESEVEGTGGREKTPSRGAGPSGNVAEPEPTTLREAVIAVVTRQPGLCKKGVYDELTARYPHFASVSLNGVQKMISKLRTQCHSKALLGQVARRTREDTTASEALTAQVADLIESPKFHELYSKASTVDPAAKEQFDAVKRTAKGGDVAAMVEVGHMYLRGEGVPQNALKAWKKFDAAHRLEPGAVPRSMLDSAAALAEGPSMWQRLQDEAWLAFSDCLEEGGCPQTPAGCRDLLAQYGFSLKKPLDKEILHSPCPDWGTFVHIASLDMVFGLIHNHCRVSKDLRAATQKCRAC
eukprot:gene21594-25973_t